MRAITEQLIRSALLITTNQNSAEIANYRGEPRAVPKVHEKSAHLLVEYSAEAEEDITLSRVQDITLKRNFAPLRELTFEV